MHTVIMRVLIEHPWQAPPRVNVGQRDVDFVYARQTRIQKLGDWAVGFRPVARVNVDLMHLVNQVPIPVTRPYVMSFEDYCPRVPEDLKAQKPWLGRLEHTLAWLLAQGSCRALMPWSEYARRVSTQQLRAYSFGQTVLDKMTIVPPPVRIRTDRPKSKNAHPKLVFVGREFQRKGGVSVLLAHQRLHDLGVPVETTIISSFGPTPSHYIRIPEKYQDCSAMLSAAGLTHLSHLGDAEVLRLIDDADYLLLPTLHDSYGYSAAEALGGATPVIASGTAAQPDIVDHGVSGWLLPIENDAIGKWVWTGRGNEPGYDDGFNDTVASLAYALTDTVLQHCDLGASVYETMSAQALDVARTRMSDAAVRSQFEQIYEEAL